MHVIWLALALLALTGLVRLHAYWMRTGSAPARWQPPPRDRYGRFVSARYAQHFGGGPGPGPSGGQRPPPPWVDINPAEELGLPPSLIEFQRVEFQRTPEMSVDEIRIGLRNWLLDNMDHFLDKKRANVGMVFCALDRNQWYGTPRAVPATAGRAAAAPKPKPPDKWCDEALVYYGFTKPAAGMVGRAAVPAEDSASATPSHLPSFGGHGGPPHHMPPPGATPTVERCGSITSPNAPLDPRPWTPAPPSRPAWMDPEYDVVGNLPARVRKHYADDPDTGLGNVPIEAEEDYYHKAKLEMQARGVNWKMFTFLPRVLEHYDEHNCKYYTAIPDGRAGTVLDKEVAETGVEYDFWDACLAEPEALPQDRGSSDPPATLESRGPEDAPLDPRPLTLDPFPMHSAAHCVASPAAAGRGP